MTSIVVCKAHPGKDKELVVQVFNVIPNADAELVSEVVLKSGETYEAVVYDNRQVISFERNIQKENEDA